jgi:hypothetical protein
MSGDADHVTLLAEQRTRLAAQRTFLAFERSLMAWLRTSLSMISFGFTLVNFFEYLQEQRGGASGMPSLFCTRTVGPACDTGTDGAGRPRSVRMTAWGTPSKPQRATWRGRV